MHQPQLTLYLNDQITTPYGATVFCALKHQKLDFKTEWVNLAAQANLNDTYQKHSKTAKVPMLLVNEAEAEGSFYISESSAICEYLNDRFAASHGALYPQDLEKRAACRQIQALIRSDFLAIRHERSMDVTFSHESKPTLSEEAKKQAQKLTFFAEQFINHQNTDYALGEWSIADIDLAIILGRLVFSQNAGEIVPQNLIDYTLKHWQQPLLQSFLALRKNHGFPVFMPEFGF